jgi:hypothetical protein
VIAMRDARCEMRDWIRPGAKVWHPTRGTGSVSSIGVSTIRIWWNDAAKLEHAHTSALIATGLKEVA